MRRFFQELIKGRMFGHPVHAMLVHFPSVFFPTALLFDIVSLVLQNALYELIAFYLLALGVLSGTIAACFGAIDYIKLPPEHKAWKIASIHGVANVLWLTIFATILGIKMMQYPHIPIVSIGQLLTNAVTVLGLIVSNYLGGELVFHYHIGSVNQE